MDSRNSTAEFLAKTDAIMVGFGHGLLMSDSQTVSCPCCAYWCTGANCPIVQEAWQYFVEEIPNYKVLLVKTEL